MSCLSTVSVPSNAAYPSRTPTPPLEQKTTGAVVRKCRHLICRSFSSLVDLVDQKGEGGKLEAKVALHKFDFKMKPDEPVTFKLNKADKDSTEASSSTKTQSIYLYFQDLRGVDNLVHLRDTHWGFGKRIKILEIHN
jgi:hypothetical protein